ncbi:MAG: NAD(P)H-dependent oxidoreductase subunit E [Planctomycetes bacterium]|nr:NAD(P)H-dependent oxidoreductase subunit E [Planctomycetota bacterium]
MTLQFSEQTQKRFDWLLTRYPTRQAALLPTLRLAEEEFGGLGLEEMKYVAGLIGVSPAHVLGVVSFYTHYRRKSEGKYVVQVCSTLPCALRGAAGVAEHLQSKLGIKCGQTTPDGKFTLKKVECLAACDRAPMMQINDDDHFDLTPEKIDRILASLK